MDNVNDAFNYFIDKYIKLYNEYCLLVKVKIHDNNNDKPWMTNCLRNACKKKCCIESF